MSMNYPNRDLAAGSVAGGTGTAAWIVGATSARTGAGVYTLTLDQPTDSTQCSVLVSRRGAAAAADGTFSVAHTSDSVKTVTYTEAGVAADADFDFHVIRAPF